MGFSRGFWVYILRLLFCSIVVFGSSPAVAQVTETNQLDINGFLLAVQTAARTLDYDGVYVYQYGASIQATRIVHVVDGTGERERLEVLDGMPRECLRHNGIEQCLLPEHKHIISRPARSDHFPGVLLANIATTENYYKWHKLPHKYRIAGRECELSELRSTDSLRYSYRLCTDLETSLLLKIQTINPEGKLIDQTSFTRIKMGAEVLPDRLVSRWDTRDWSIWTELSNTVDLQAQGWRYVSPLGFEPIAELARQLGPDHAVEQLVLSDGLAAISLFIETFNPEQDQNIKQGRLHNGAVNVYRKRLASFWLTVVGEVPLHTISELAQAVQYVPEAAK